MKNLQAQLNQAVQETNSRIIILFEGRDSAGKSGAIKCVSEYLPLADYRIIHSKKPNESQMRNWLSYWGGLLTYAARIPNYGSRILLCDRSWYSRALVQRVNGWCTERQAKNFLKNVGKFERDIRADGTILLKFWLSISEETQRKRLQLRKISPLTYWKYSSNDEKALSSYDKMTLAKEEVVDDSWHVVDFNNKRNGQKRVLEIIIQELLK